MTLPTIVELTNCISNLAVVASLIFLIRQVRQGSRNQRATMRHGRVQQLQMIYQQASHGDFVNILTRGLAGDVTLDRADCNRFVWFMAAVFNMFENMFDQHRDGIIDKATFSSATHALQSQLALPGARAAWMTIRDRYQKGYVDHVDRLMSATPINGVADLSAAWRGFVPSERCPS
jgi:hypothetical protein